MRPLVVGHEDKRQRLALKGHNAGDIRQRGGKQNGGDHNGDIIAKRGPREEGAV